MTPAQIEMDALENAVLTAVFGNEYQNSKAFKMAEAFFPGRIQSYINRFENLVKPFMNEDGTTDGARLKQVLLLEHPSLSNLVPSTNFRLTDIASAVTQFIKGA